MKTKDHMRTVGANTQWGAATSASSMNRRVGTAGRSSLWCWVPGDGWVKWSELYAQVAKAYEQWRIRRSLEGKRTWDGFEDRQMQIESAVKKREATQPARQAA